MVGTFQLPYFIPFQNTFQNALKSSAGIDAKEKQSYYTYHLLKKCMQQDEQKKIGFEIKTRAEVDPIIFVSRTHSHTEEISKSESKLC